MAKHFENGGCGIRPFLDLWILEHCVPYDREACDRLLEQGKLLTFAEACRKLSEMWFDCAEPDEISEQMQSYILYGGAYGTLKNHLAVHQNKLGGRFKYFMSRIFLPYDSLKFLYPVLQKHRWLTPVMQVCRWFRLLFKGRMKKSLHEINVSQTISKDKINETADQPKQTQKDRHDQHDNRFHIHLYDPFRRSPAASRFLSFLHSLLP